MKTHKADRHMRSTNFMNSPLAMAELCKLALLVKRRDYIVCFKSRVNSSVHRRPAGPQRAGLLPAGLQSVCSPDALQHPIPPAALSWAFHSETEAQERIRCQAEFAAPRFLPAATQQ